MPVPQLSKSRFLSGLQCHKRLYLELYMPHLGPPTSYAQQALFDLGARVGELARDLFPGGRLITEDYLHHKQAEVSTRRALADPKVPFIYEGAFTHNRIRIRADILAPVGDGEFDLIEVKSSTRAKEEHHPDLGVQLYVLEGCGVTIHRAWLLHLDNTYEYAGGDYDLNRLFAMVDLTTEIRSIRLAILDALGAMRQSLSLPSPPELSVGRHCSSPYDCPFTSHCRENGPGHPLIDLPGVRAPVLQRLGALGIEDIRQIPEGFPGLTALQRRVHSSLVSGEPYFDPAVSAKLSRLSYPIHFIDFETINPALPLYPGTRPYQVIPFQWSDHIVRKDGTQEHKEFLHEGISDPRLPFAKSLLDALGPSGSIVAYSSYEATQLRELARAVPDMASELLGAAGLIVDLLPLVRDHCYHPDFHGSFSIKKVLPALVPGSGYDGLEVAEGDAASVAFLEMLQPGTPLARREALRSALLAYCRRDTEAMVQLYCRLL